MTAVRNRSWRSLAFVTALATVFALALPFIQATPAEAQVPSGCTLEVREEIDTNPVGTVHTLTAQLYQGTSATACNVNTDTAIPVNVDFEIESGPAVRTGCTVGTNDSTCTGGTANNDGNSPTSPDLTCDIGASGGASSCQVRFTSDGVGTNVIRAWVDSDRADATTEADASEGRYSGTTDCGTRTSTVTDPTDGTRPCALTTATPGGTAEPDLTDVVEKRWSQSISGDTCVDVDPNDDTNPSGTEHTLTLTATNRASRAASTTSSPSDDSCGGAGTTARAGVEATFTITGDTPNAFFVSVNGQSTNPSGGGPNSVTCTTDANGQCTAVIKTVDPNATGTNTIVGAVSGSTSGANQTETVTKNWVSSSAVTNVNASPEEDTNETGTSHSVSGTVTNALGNPVAGQLLTFDITAGPNSTVNVDSDPATPVGFIGQCSTDATGSCSRSYSSAVVGTDTITVCIDSNTNFECDGAETNSGNTTAGDANDDQVIKTWVSPGQGAATLSLDMEGCNGSTTNPADTSYEATATANQVSQDRNDAHAVCARVFNATNGEFRTPVTFTITSGPGSFIRPSATNDATFVDGSTNDLGNSVTVEPGTCATGAGGGSPANAGTAGTGAGSGAYACAFLLSQATGNTVVQACVAGSTTICDTGTKPWIAGAGTARNIDADPESATNPVGTTHEITATVVDRFGNPVQGVAVSWSRTGVGVVISQENTTNAAGEARAVVQSTTEGETSITASIGAGATDCELAAGAPAGTSEGAGATAGNCTVTVTKTWEEEPPPAECSDGIDNDGDGRVDQQDLGCYDEDGNYDPDDDSEAGEALDRTVHPRTIEITKFKHIDLPGKKKPALMVKGRVTVDDGFAECNNFAPVKIQLRASGEWITRKTDITNENGVFKVLIRHVHAKYRAIATRFELFDEFGNVDVCQRAEDVRRYRH